MDDRKAMDVHRLMDTLAAALKASCERFAPRAALSWPGGTMSYRVLDAVSTNVAEAYRELGIGFGARIVCQLPNRSEVLIAALAAWKRGAVHIGADKDLTGPEMASLVQWTEASAAVVQGEPRGSAVVDALQQYPQTQLIVSGGSLGKNDHCHQLSDLLKGRDSTAEPQQHQESVGPEDAAVILLTSGTTGTRKGVIRRQGQLLEHWTRTASLLGASPDDTHLVQLPLAHGFGFGLAIAALLTGGRLILVDHFSPVPVLRLIEEEGITILNGTPPHFRLLLDKLDRSVHDLSTLRIGSGSAARFQPNLLRGIFGDLSMDFVLAYGCSEGLGWKTSNREEMLRGSVGRPPPDRIRVVALDGSALPPGQTGEIQVRKTHTVDYWGEEDKAGEADPEWHRMGDLGRIDEGGYLYVFGRVKHQVNRGGVRIDPGEVEEALCKHPSLADAAVIGMPDRVLGEIVCACVVPRAASSLGLPEVRTYLSTSLAKHKLPEKLCIVERIPRTALGKVDRAALSALPDAHI